MTERENELQERLRESHATINDLMTWLVLSYRDSGREFSRDPAYDKAITTLARNAIALGSSTNTAAFSQDIDRRVGEIRRGGPVKGP